MSEERTPHSALRTPHSVGLIGWPVAHSLSPVMQDAAFAACGLEWRYELWPVPPEALAITVAGLRRGVIAGANVTVPHKTAVLPLLDDAAARRRSGSARSTRSFMPTGG